MFRTLIRPAPFARLYTTASPKGAKIFETTERSFDKDVLEATTPTLVDFYASWCQPCKILGPLLSKSIQQDGRVNLAKINVDENQELARDYKITSLPTVMAFRDGEPVGAFIGMRPPKDVDQFVKDVAENTLK